ncbi:hypothetical protein MNB_SV-5-1114 [hydrothermal vent metagenome]|uniref:Copper resistance protein D domain-containing protein n=1 Tax=hydrothermal vent metagenome TaxID=652676 RepID=A0A1W1EDX8_9ZZZZ
MKSAMVGLFGTYAHEIVFLHVLSAIIWVGGMIAIRFAVHPNMQMIEDPKVKLGRTLAITGKFFHLVIPFILILIVTAVLMAVGLGFRIAAVDETGTIISQTAYDLYQVVHMKEVVWMIMTANFTWMYIKRRKAQKLFDLGDLPAAKATVALIPKYLLPINISLGILALWLGLTLRGL